MQAGVDRVEEFRLRDGPSIELDAAGFLHPTAPRSKQTAFTRYGADLLESLRISAKVPKE